MLSPKPLPPFPWHDPFQVSLLRIPCPRCAAPAGHPCDMRMSTRLIHLARSDKAMRLNWRERRNQQ